MDLLETQKEQEVKSFKKNKRVKIAAEPAAGMENDEEFEKTMRAIERE